MPLVREYQMDGLKQRIDEYFMRCEQPSIHKLFLADEFNAESQATIFWICQEVMSNKNIVRQ